MIIATHSLEFTASLLAELEATPDQASVIALNQKGGVIDPVVIAGPDAHRRVVELSDDLRI